MPQALKTIGEALQVDRMLVLEHAHEHPSTPTVSLSSIWQVTDVLQLDSTFIAKFDDDSPELAAWFAPLLDGKPVASYADTATGIVSQMLRETKNLSTLLVPISIKGKYWGHIGIDDCKNARQWSPVEIDTLGTLSEVIGSLVIREQTTDSLQKSEERFRTVSETVPDAIIMVDAAAKVRYWNRAAERILGYTPNEAIGKSVHEWLAPPRFRDKAAIGMSIFSATGNGDIIGKTLELSAIRKDGVEIPIELSVASMPLGAERHAVAILRDITERQRTDELLRRMARYDNLTGLANRAVFVETLQQAIARAHRGRESFAVLYLDLDHFKDINDTLGHPIGDLLLKSVAERLRMSIRETDTVARFGGDEFALIETGVAKPVEAAALADKILKALSEPFSILGNVIRSGASIGIAVYGVDSPDAESLLSHADVALYRAKSDGRGTYRFFTDTMDVEVRARVALGTELCDAMTGDQFFLVYQPQVNIDTGRIVGVEALVRWHHPQHGVLQPGKFIPAAEESGLIVVLGHWVLREACRQMKEWLDAGIAPPLIAVNVSGLQFKRPLELENDIKGVLAETDLPPQRLELEITESALMDVSRDHNDVLLRLRKAGLRIAIDDFGTGYSSLEYLGRFPVDRIKIAQNFLRDLTKASSNAAIVRASIGLAHTLNLDVMVEGVETSEQLAQVKSWGARKVQGYYFSRPLTADDLTAVLRSKTLLPKRPVPVVTAAE